MKIDEEKMREYEEKLNQERDAFKRQMEEQQSNIEKNADIAQAEKDRLINELREKDKAQEKAKKKKEQMMKRMKKMEEKLVVGNQAKEIAKEQKKQLKQKKNEL